MAEDTGTDHVVVVIDGNDGTGKDTVAAILRERLPKSVYRVEVRGLPTKLTDQNMSLAHIGEARHVYFILDAPVHVCRSRLTMAGKDLDEKYHTVADLTFYRERFLLVCGSLHNAYLVNTERSVTDIIDYIGLRLIAAHRQLNAV